VAAKELYRRARARWILQRLGWPGTKRRHGLRFAGPSVECRDITGVPSTRRPHGSKLGWPRGSHGSLGSGPRGWLAVGEQAGQAYLRHVVGF
jgi:hypothetical protein